MNDKNQPSENSPQSQRELIVTVRPESGINAASLQPNGITGINDIDDLISENNASFEPLFDNLNAAENDSEDIANVENNQTSFFRVDADDERLEEIASKLQAHNMVEAAYIKPAGELPIAVAEAATGDQELDYEINTMTPRLDAAPAVTPNYISRQGYLNPAPEGVDARYAWRFAGGRGNNVRVIDLEWGWRFTHEDLRINQGGVIAGTNSSSTNHGTAVIGEIGGDFNNFGITGISPDARVSAVAFSMPTARAIRIAADNLRPGDIMLLEIHRAGPRFNFQGRADQRGYIAVEWWPDDFAAIRYATSRGIIVIEAAGNGAENFDDPIYSQRPTGFPSSWRNPFDPANTSSLAVVCGAGAPPPGTHGRNHGPDRSRLGFSNYGRRVDAQGWGREVTTTGYGDLQGGHPDRQYTDGFSGTSSASPIVTAAVACVQGSLRAHRQTLLTPTGVINLLRTTGSPQTDAPGRPRTQRIGNRPNLRQMMDRMVRPSTTYTGVWRSGNDAHYLWVNASWTNFVNKWRELAQRNLRLQDFEITKFGNNFRYSGVWRSGNDPYYLWVNATWSSFVEKWRDLASRNLRLVDIEITKIGSQWRYSGVWRSGNDPYYLWVNATWSSFVEKWRDLASRNLRLVDIEITKIGSQWRYSGVWRGGSDAHYLWVNATWANFVAKWRDLAQRNLRLTKIVRIKIGNQWRYSGVWRAGRDSYYLWANASWPNFVDKWSQLNRQNLRLVDFEISQTQNNTPSISGFENEADSTRTDDNLDSSNGFGGGDIMSNSQSIKLNEADANGADFDSASGDPCASQNGDLFEQPAADGFGGGNTEIAGIAQSVNATANSESDFMTTDDDDGYGLGYLVDDINQINADTKITDTIEVTASEDDSGNGFGGGSESEDLASGPDDNPIGDGGGKLN